MQFTIDDELDGKHVLKCPACGHEHYRYVNKGRITDQRWGSANRPVQSYQVPASTISYSAVSSTSSNSVYITWTYSTGTTV